MRKDYTGILLAGGKSKRMGEDKSLLKIKGETILARLHKLLSNLFDEVLIVTFNNSKHEHLSGNILQDVYPGYGPLSGIHAGLVNSTSDKNFIISCDIPFLSKELIKFIIMHDITSDITLPKTGEIIHSLCGIYKKSCLDKTETLLKSAANSNVQENGKTKIKLFDLINSVDTKLIEIGNQKFYSEDLMFNMNTIEDYEHIKKRLC